MLTLPGHPFEADADDYAGNTSTTGTVSVGGSRTGSIETAGDTDWFRVTLAAGATYQFDLKGSATSDGTLPDPFLRLRDSAGNSLTFDDDGGSGLNARISGFTAVTSGTYFLSIGSSTTSGIGTYRVSATQTGTPPPTDDYAASTSTTGTVSAGGSKTGSIETAGDTDWFRITLTTGATYQFDLKGSATSDGTLPDPFLRLRDSAGNSLTSDDDSGSGLNSSIAGYTATTGGTYYLSVGSSTASGTGTYRVSATQTAAPPPADDYEGSTATAGTVSVGGSRTGSIEAAGDTDWFRITLAASTTYVFDLKGSDTGDGTLPDPFLRLRDSAGISLTFDDDSGTGLNSSIAGFMASTSGIYYLSVGSSTTNGTGTYRLSATQTAAPPAADDFAGSVATSGAVGIGGSSTGTIETAGDTDWLKVTLTAGATYRFDLEGSDTSRGTLADPFLRLRDSVGSSIIYDDDGGSGLNAQIAFSAATSGTYYLSVGSSTANGTGTYRLTATQTGAPTSNDDFAANLSTTGTISVGGLRTGNIEKVGDTDWFRINLQAGYAYSFDAKAFASGDGTLADPFIRLRNEDGNSLLSDDDGGNGTNAHLAHVATYSGVYYISVGSALSQGDTGSYLLSAIQTATPSLNDDFAASRSTTGEAGVGRPATGIIEVPGDTDWFKAVLEAGTTYQFEMMAAGSGRGTLADPFMRLRDGGGNSLSSDDNSGAGSNALITFTPNSSGTFYLSAGSSSPTTDAGSYQIEMRIVPSLAPPPPGVNIGDSVPLILAPVQGFRAGQFINQPLHQHSYIKGDPNENSSYWSIDFGGSLGAKLVAGFSGTVVGRSGIIHPNMAPKYDATEGNWYINDGSNGHLGNFITIKLDNADLFVTYAHLDAISISGLDVGDRVVKGNILASLGGTGEMLGLTADSLYHTHVMIGTSTRSYGTYNGIPEIVANSSKNANPDHFFDFVDANNVIFNGASSNANAINGMGGGAFDYSFNGTEGNDLATSSSGYAGVFLFGGDDLVVLSGGHNGVFGGSGNDTISYAATDGAIVVTLDNSANGGGAAGDSFSSIENVVGSAFSDRLTGDATGNTLIGGGGDDVLNGGGGNDVLIGGAGTDIARFHSAQATNVIVAFNGTVAVFNAAAHETDWMQQIESLQFDDALLQTAALPQFHALDYIASYDDLVPAFGTNADSGFAHFVNFGFFEGRAQDRFDGLQYIASGDDLIRTFGLNEQAAAVHFINFGLAEGRARDSFDGFQYIASHNDLILTLGLNDQAAAIHFINFGLAEGRARDSFEGFQYIASHDDLIRTFGLNEQAAAVHFINFGFAEGRARDSFDGFQYIASHDDLIRTYGLNDQAAAVHFIAFGLAEGRARDSFDGFQYIASHDDLIRALGANDQAAAIHFIAFGLAEGRSRDSFDAAQYLANYADLRAAFGPDQQAAAIHYINFGYYEGRTDDPLFG